MVRDPRDRYASVVKRWKRSRGGVGAATAMWIASVDLATRNRERYPEGYLVVRYEDLAARPEEILRTICAHIGEAFEPAMLSMQGDREFRDAGGNSSYGALEPGVISTSSIGRFREVLGDDQIEYIERRAGGRMVGLGYSVQPVQRRFVRKLRYAAFFQPLQMARAGLWHGREGVRDLIGRSPSAHTMAARLRDADA
jgi:hypothetical protein